MGNLKIGWAEESITPDKKVKLAGQFFERISEYVETPVTVTAMAVESDDEQMIICSCDITSVAVKLLDRVRKRIEGKINIPAEKIIINATHNHTSLAYDRSGGIDRTTLHILKRYLPENKQYQEKVPIKDDVMDKVEALEFLAEKISSAAVKAWNNRKDALYSNEFGRAAVGMCRRVTYDDGSAKMWGDTNSANFVSLESGNDSGIELLYIFDKNRTLNGVVANVACPAQVVEHRSFISADYWGKAKMFLRKKFGDNLYVLGLCSAAGDQCPRDLIRWVNPEMPIDDPNVSPDAYIERNADPSMFDLKGCTLIGKRIANEIISVYEEIEDIKDSAFMIHEVLNIDMPIRRVTEKEYHEADRAIKDYIDKSYDIINFADNAIMHVYAGTILRYEMQHSYDMHPTEIHIIRFGDIAIATNPFELFLDYGNQIRARSKAKQTFLIQLACGSNSYLPTKKAEEGGHYSAYVSSGITGHLGGEMLVRKTVSEINRLMGA